MKDGFKTGTGCFKCESCGKLTRQSKYNDNPYACGDCNERQMHENSHADNDFENDDCGDEKCPVKHYTEKQRWWRH